MQKACNLGDANGSRLDAMLLRVGPTQDITSKLTGADIEPPKNAPNSKSLG